MKTTTMKIQESGGGLQINAMHVHRTSSAQAPAAEVIDVASHFVIVQEQINHGQQRSQSSPNQ